MIKSLDIFEIVVQVFCVKVVEKFVCQVNRSEGMGVLVVEVVVFVKLFNDYCNKFEREIQEVGYCCGWLMGGWRRRLKVRGCRNILDMECC